MPSAGAKRYPNRHLGYYRGRQAERACYLVESRERLAGVAELVKAGKGDELLESDRDYLLMQKALATKGELRRDAYFDEIVNIARDYANASR